MVIVMFFNAALKKERYILPTDSISQQSKTDSK
jgi:hypothetical protein